MGLGAEDYREAALEHIGLSFRAFERSEYTTAHYYAGVAVECMLRAYLSLRKKGQGFESRHDISLLAREAGFFDLVPQDGQAEWGARFSDLNLRWRSNHRYYCRRAFRSYLWSAGLLRRGAKKTMRGDIFKANARIVCDAANDIVALGEKKWKSSIK